MKTQYYQPILLCITAVVLPYQKASAQLTNLPASWSYPSTSANLAQPGFQGAIRQARSDTNLSATVSRGNTHLQDLLIDSTTEMPYFNTAVASNNPDIGSWTGSLPTDPGGSFTIPTVINFSGDSVGEKLDEGLFYSGNGLEDSYFPGLPGDTSEGAVNFSNGLNFSAEFVAFVHLPAGPVTFGVRSNDAMQLAFHPNDARDIFRQSLLIQDTNVSTANRTATVNVATAGLYSVRLMLAEWLGGSALEFYSESNGSPVLVNAVDGPPLGDPPVLSISHSAGQINLSWTGDGTLLESPDLISGFQEAVDQTNPQVRTTTGREFYRMAYASGPGPSIKAYRSITSPTRPYVSSVSPGISETGVALNANIGITMQNRAGAIPVMRVNGGVVVPAISDNGATSTITYDPPSNFTSGQTINVELDYGNTTSAWSFIAATGQKALLIAGTIPLGGGDAAVATRLASEFGLDVVPIDDSTDPALVETAAEDAVLVFHSSTSSGAEGLDIATALKDNPIPIVCVESGNADEYSMGGSTMGQNVPIGSISNVITIIEDHPVDGGLPLGASTILTSNEQAHLITPYTTSPGLLVGRTHSYTSGGVTGARPTLLVIESGTTVNNGAFFHPNRRVFFGIIGNNGAEKLNENGRALFDAVIQWALDGTPSVAP